MNAKSPRLTVGMPVYNGQRYLSQALDSILGQTFTDFEVIISDNASTDATPEVCAEYQKKDPRVHYLRQEKNLGASRNFNFVLEKAQGELFKWASHDDICSPDFFEACVTELDRCPEAVLCYAPTVLIDEQGQPVRPYDDNLDLRHPQADARFRQFVKVYRHAHSCNPIFGVMRTAVLRQTGWIGSFVSSDMVLLGELALRGEIHAVPQAVFYRRDHAQASVRAYPAYRDRIVWFDPSKKGTLQMTHWIWFRTLWQAIRRTPLPPSERTNSYRSLLRWARWNRRGLSKDLLKACLWPFWRRIQETELARTWLQAPRSKPG